MKRVLYKYYGLMQITTIQRLRKLIEFVIFIIGILFQHILRLTNMKYQHSKSLENIEIKMLQEYKYRYGMCLYVFLPNEADR